MTKEVGPGDGDRSKYGVQGDGGRPLPSRSPNGSLDRIAVGSLARPRSRSDERNRWRCVRARVATEQPLARRAGARRGFEHDQVIEVLGENERWQKRRGQGEGRLAWRPAELRLPVDVVVTGSVATRLCLRRRMVRCGRSNRIGMHRAVGGAQPTRFQDARLNGHDENQDRRDGCDPSYPDSEIRLGRAAFPLRVHCARLWVTDGAESSRAKLRVRSRCGRSRGRPAKSRAHHFAWFTTVCVFGGRVVSRLEFCLDQPPREEGACGSEAGELGWARRSPLGSVSS